jgi:hypothetical protein
MGIDPTGAADTLKITNYSTIVNGSNNQIIGDFNFIGGGSFNKITGDYARCGCIESFARSSVIVGGSNNKIEMAACAAILGGRYNEVSHNGATIIGDGSLNVKTSKGACSLLLSFQNGIYLESPIFNFTGGRPTVDGTGVFLVGEIPVLPSTVVYTTGDQEINDIKNFLSRPTVNNTGVVLSGEAVSPFVDINNITEHFNFISEYNSKLLTVNSTQPITGTVQLNLPTGYNVSFTQIGVGQLHITGQNGVTIRQKSNLYYTAGRYAMASLVHHSGNQYILYGDLG